jgi:DMSO/TMAO reductase YedYZ molybdopterin-dependent catalytic subunit
MPTRLFPIIGEREPEPFDPLTWRLEIDGLVENPLSLSWSDLAGLPHVSRTGTIHCVTRWSRPETTFHGVRLAHLLKHAGPRADARFVRFVSGRGHDSTLPLGRAKKEVLVADGFGVAGSGAGESDEPGSLAPEHGGPVRSVVFDRYFYKSVKWLRRIELLDADRLGFWERTAGYHNDADPWREQRYVAHDLDRAALRRLLDARDLSTQNLLGAELGGANLDGFRLESANLRNAKLMNASLRGADLREASLCNADLRHADLRQTLIDGVDLDGADLRGADLRCARGRPASMAAAQFSESTVAARGDGDSGAAYSGSSDCRVDGLDWNGTALDAVLPDQLAFLRAHGVLRD